MLAPYFPPSARGVWGTGFSRNAALKAYSKQNNIGCSNSVLNFLAESWQLTVAGRKIDGYFAFSFCPSLYEERRDAGLFMDRLDSFRQKRRNAQDFYVFQL